jgi:CheY-like chemotaxis protein
MEPTMPDLILIEDDELLRRMLARLLERHGFSVREAGNGLEGLKLMRERPAPLVVTDLIMPEMEGIETIRHLRRLYPETRIVAISQGGAIGPKCYLAIATQLGADHTLAKPFRPEQLLRLVAELLAPSPLAAHADDGD